jgi:mevalonate kinase
LINFSHTLICFEPFIEDITVKVIDEVVTLTQEKSQDLKETLTEAEGLLVSYTRKTYQRMAEIDQRLRGKGYPKSVNIQKTDRYETPMIEFIKGSVSAELKTYRPKSRFEQFYQNMPNLHNRYISAERKISQKNLEYMLNYSLPCSCS